MLNWIWLGMIFLSFLSACITGRWEAVVNAIHTSIRSTVEVMIVLAGTLSFWLGLMKIAEASGVVQALARWLTPVLHKLFPDVPKDHPAMGHMVMNMAANIFGMGNAATPFGLKAMESLQSLNKQKDKASHAMCMFLAINTSSIQIIPASTIALMAASGVRDPQSILITGLIATVITTLFSVSLALFLRARKGA